MKVALLSTYSYSVALGLRYVSSFLKRAGHEVHMIFMASKRATAEADFDRSLLGDLLEHLRDRDLIGISLMTNTFYRSAALTRVIREAGIRAPIVWGGTHPTVAPAESLDVADVICVGEGEWAMVELADRLSLGKDPKDIPGLGFRAEGPFGNSRGVTNAVAPLDRNLDAYPLPDYDLETHWVSKRGRLVPATPDNLRGALHRLRVLSTRGCPNRCTFCNNTAWRRVYEGKGPWVRMRSVDNVLREIESMRRRFGSIEAVNIVDDLFFVRSEEEIAEFAAQYGDRVNLPLELDAFPNTMTEGKVRALARLPIALVSMGIESASPDTLERIYQRHTPIENVIRGIELLHRHRIPAEYHYLVSNPYEPDGNVVETMRFIASHHKPAAALRVFPVMFYPGSPLSERAEADGLLGRHDERAYRYTYTGNTQFAGHNYLAVWLRVVLQLRNMGLRPGAAHRLIDFAAHPLVRRALDRPWFTPLAFGLYQVARKLVRNLVYEPFIRPLRRLRRSYQTVQ
jgi:radical SAM superfamily enzyme YgiQ (UPF0313 family)